MDDIKKSVLDLMLKNRRTSGEHQYTVPSPITYPYQWLWDSCFHAIILSHFNVEDAKKELLSIISKQFNNGMVPHMIYWEKKDVINFDWGKDGTSSITQPPMLAYAAWQIFQKDSDLEFLKSIYIPLFHFYKYLINDRDPHENDLIGIIDPDESGEDNSPRFDTLLNLPPVQTREKSLEKRLLLVKENKTCNFDAPFCMKNFFWVKDVPFNVIMVENLRALSSIAEKLGNSHDVAYFNKKREMIIKAMRTLMYEDGLFWSTYGEDYQKIKLKTWAIFSPLFANILTQGEAKELVEKHLLNNKEFQLEYSVPTVSIDEPSFDPSGFWRGPTWIATNWIIHKGLLNYGFTDIADDIKKKSIELIKKSGFREYFNPQTGEGLGAKDFTWGGLIVDMNGN